MEIQDGEVVPDTKEQILDSMVADAAQFFDTTFSDSEQSVVRTFYEPIAEQLAELQVDSSIILQATQIDNAVGTQLDLLCALIGVKRLESKRATGEVTFYRDAPSDVRDYNIPSGVIVRTEGSNPISFRTSESATLEMGSTEVTVPIEAVDKGTRANVNSGVIVNIRENISGIDGVTNDLPTEGGREEESDDELRERAKDNLANGSAATANALITSISQVEQVQSVQIFPNRGDLGSMPGWEIVAHGGNDQDIADTIAEKMAAGEVPYSGNYGTSVQKEATLVNGQTWPVEFSRPEQLDVYIDATITREDNFAGTDAVADSITDYIGGIRTSGNTTNGEISVGDDVLYGEIQYAVRDVTGVYDVTDLVIDTAQPPGKTTNLTVEEFQVAITDSNENINITVNEQ